MPRLSVPVLSALVFACVSFLSRSTAAESVPAEKAAPVPEGQGRLEIELLRAPVPKVAEALLEITGDPAEDGKLRGKLLAGGATKVMQCAVTGPCGKELKSEKLKLTREPVLFEYGSLWQIQNRLKKEGKKVPPFDKDVSSEEHTEGHALTATLEESTAGILAKIAFAWNGPPVVRTVNSWPVKGRVAKIIQDRIWELNTQRTLTSGELCLLAVAPEPPGGEGKPTGFSLLAFGKVTARPAEPASPRLAAPRTTQCWTFEMPVDEGRRWLARRTGLEGDDKECFQLLSNGPPTVTASLVSVLMLREDCETEELNQEDSVDSRLKWWEPRGFEPPDTCYSPFISVPNDMHDEYVAQRLETRNRQARLTLPVGGVKWSRWHGSTRGAADEPVGVESSATGHTTGNFFVRRAPGWIFLANAHACGPKMRLTFARAYFPEQDRAPSREDKFLLLETPLEPWLPRLAAGADLTTLVPELTAALTNDTAGILHTEVITAGGQRWQREDTWPWMSMDQYLNPSIHDNKFCFNPRQTRGSSPAGSMETEGYGSMGVRICGEPAARRFGLWLPDVPGHSATTSGISLTEWPEFTGGSAHAPPPDRDAILHVSLGRSWSRPEQPVLHWFVFRSRAFPGAEPSEPAPPAGALRMAAFTITGAEGAILAHATLPAGDATLRDGRMIESLEPRELPLEHHFQEKVPEVIAAKAQQMSGALEISSILDGLDLIITGDKWTLEHSLSPARSLTETLTAYSEQPVSGGDYKSDPVRVSCERLVLTRETLTGTLPAAGESVTQDLVGGRKLTVKVR